MSIAAYMYQTISMHERRHFFVAAGTVKYPDTISHKMKRRAQGKIAIDTASSSKGISKTKIEQNGQDSVDISPKRIKRPEVETQQNDAMQKKVKTTREAKGTATQKKKSAARGKKLKGNKEEETKVKGSCGPPKGHMYLGAHPSIAGSL